MTKAIVIGATGGIGSTVAQFLKKNYSVITVNRNSIDFNNPNAYELLNILLVSHEPDLIVNCTGHFADNTEKHHDTMNVNIGSNWAIIKYYIENKPNKKTRLIMIGSSAYREGRKLYMMYSASKAALYNLWLSACEYFDNSNLSLVLINPVKTKTKMMNPKATTYIMPEDVARCVLEHSFGDDNKCIDMSYHKELRND